MAEPSRSEARKIIMFFLIASGFTWVFWTSEVLAARGLLVSSILVDFLLSPQNPAA